tara:strand:- start:1025 stop:1198 length:174 start_codon:yes stop_codon:yes gene_type:complete
MKIVYNQTTTKEVSVKLLSDVWSWLKEWNDWQMKDWIKAGIVAIIIIIVLSKMTTGA